MRQFILRDSSVFALPAMTRRYMNVMFYHYLNHLVPEEAHSIVDLIDWSYTEDYIWWFCRMLHNYMIQDVLVNPSRPTHQEILEEK